MASALLSVSRTPTDDTVLLCAQNDSALKARADLAVRMSGGTLTNDIYNKIALALRDKLEIREFVSSNSTALLEADLQVAVESVIGAVTDTTTAASVPVEAADAATTAAAQAS